MTPLARHLGRLIRLAGPISVARYMAEALAHPGQGYYANARLGADGDFVTAPELSQMFGELIGLALAESWQALGRPAPVRLVELGPGRGLLLHDLLRAARAVPGFLAAIDLHLVETSAALRAEQAERIARPAVWHDRLEQVPAGPLLLIANEFFDALPVRQFARSEAGWRERLVGLDGEAFAFTLAPLALPIAALPERFAALPPGRLAEVSSAREALMQGLAERLSRQGGVALIADYGQQPYGVGDSLQALSRQRKVAPLASPGVADLTAQVDFAGLAAAARAAGAEVHGPVEQGAYLRALGIGARAARLCREANPAQAQRIEAALARLTRPEQMGSLFKFLAVQSPGLPVPQGFVP
ncbi:MAG: class I SAM-dependent methyltransferase [Alphaproteobacteria bacterium]|nr:class I SAM-dependent methyltransferase [Alphaproteobacteria bacterium]